LLATVTVAAPLKFSGSARKEKVLLLFLNGCLGSCVGEPCMLPSANFHCKNERERVRNRQAFYFILFKFTSLSFLVIVRFGNK